MAGSMKTILPVLLFFYFITQSFSFPVTLPLRERERALSIQKRGNSNRLVVQYLHRGSRQAPVQTLLKEVGPSHLVDATIDDIPVSLILDTGSALLVAPRTGCRCTPNCACGTEHDAPAIPCSDRTKCSSGSCFGSLNACRFSSTYGDGTTLAGVLQEGKISLGSLSTTMTYGGILNLTVLKNTDGIFGLARPVTSLTCQPSCMTPLFDKFVLEKKAKNVFGIYFTEKGGGLTLGGYDTSLAPTPVWNPFLHDAYYSATIADIYLSGVKFYGKVKGKLDSGTTFIVFPNAVFSSFKNEYLRQYSDLPGVKEYFIDGEDRQECFLESELDKYPYPDLTFRFAKVEVTLKPRQYFTPQTLGRNKFVCWTITGMDIDFLLLGGSFFKAFYVVFDRETNHVGFSALPGSMPPISLVTPPPTSAPTSPPTSGRIPAPTSTSGPTPNSPITPSPTFPPTSSTTSSTTLSPTPSATLGLEPTPTLSKPSSENSGLSTGAKVGIALAVVGGITAGVLVVAYLVVQAKSTPQYA